MPDAPAATPVLSTTSTRLPLCARCQAVERPWTPAPTTRTGTEDGRELGIGRLLWPVVQWRCRTAPIYTNWSTAVTLAADFRLELRRTDRYDDRGGRRQRRDAARSGTHLRRHGADRARLHAHRARTRHLGGGPQPARAARADRGDHAPDRGRGHQVRLLPAGVGDRPRHGQGRRRVVLPP